MRGPSGKDQITMTATVRTNSNVQPRQTLASQPDRLDGILDGLDATLAGANLQFSDLIVPIPDIA
jgi:hypothetical protein